MGKIALREYHRKIENLIERHAIDEALSHCANILLIYPKEIETYRKLGKIFLEKQDYALAEKVFNIILSVFPDDFVANVGLSFINENNNHMDEAIEHMLMAFELQPANPSLQDELKRLYHKRDNVEPNKIRLTRGSLIKMYARSLLYEQAIAEIKLGLYEKPGRIDFRLTLAEMLWKSGKHIEAVETSVEVISRLPYCWKANEILNSAFSDLHQEQAENNYRARLCELDPYFRYMLPTTRDVADIPDISEQLESELVDGSFIADWDAFLSQTWASAAAPAQDESVISDLDWDSILDEAGQEKEAAEEEPLSAGIALFQELTHNLENESTAASKRQSFIERLQKRSQESSLEGIAGQTESPAESPDAAMENHDHIPIEESDVPQDNQPEALPSDDLADQIAPSNSSEGMESETTNSAEEEPDAGMEFPSIADESGIIDHDVPVEIPADADSAIPASQWISAEADAEPSPEQSTPVPLQDTQQIRLVPPTREDILAQARKMIAAEKIPLALKYLQDLTDDDENLKDIRILLEDACRDYPQDSNLWLALGNIYQRLNQKEKALEVFTRAQKFISL